MKPTLALNKLTALLMGLSFLNVPLSAWAQSTAFTYQGRLNDGTTPAAGLYVLTFALFQNPTGGGAVLGPITNSAVNVSNEGLFTTLLDFGPYDTDAYARGRWLEISVGTNGAGTLTVLSPRQRMTPAPSAIYANYANYAIGAAPGSGFSADLLDGLNSSAFWQTGGNIGTTPGANFLGTADDQPLEFKVNGLRALRIENNGNGAPSVIGGSPVNFVAPGVVGATIAGGGATSYAGIASTNRVLGNFGSILGGLGNTASGDYSTAMGMYTIASGDYSTAMGVETTASNDYSTAMGVGTTAGGQGSTAMGSSTSASGDYAFAAGYNARANHTGAFVWSDPQPTDFVSSASNQFLIRASGGVGIGTTVPQAPLHVAAGMAGWITANTGAIALFERNTDGYLSIVTPPTSEQGILFGSPAASTDGAIVFNNAATAGGLQFRTTGNYTRMVIQANGNVGIGTVSPASALQVIGTVTATAFNPPSDRNLKENFAEVSPREVLDQVAALPISRWNFKEDIAVRHLGPMAQDFYAAFALGTDDKHIATVDADGVALAAIQGLNQKLEEQRSQLEQKQTEITELKQAVNELKELVGKLARPSEGTK